MKDDAVAALQDALSENFQSARQHLMEMGSEDLKCLQRACMALQNLAGARLYALAQQRDVRYQRRLAKNVAGAAKLDENDFFEA